MTDKKGGIHFVENFLELPKVCPKCGKKNEEWLDGTFGCGECGNIIAYRNMDVEFSLWYYNEQDIALTLKAVMDYVEELEKEIKAGLYQTTKQLITRRLREILGKVIEE